MKRSKWELPVAYDPERQEPAVRKSICTGEMTLGLLDGKTGYFMELIRADSQRDLDEFCRRTGVKELKTIY